MNKVEQIEAMVKRMGFVLTCCNCEERIESDDSNTAEDLAAYAMKWNWACDNNGDPYCGDCRE